MQRYASPQSKVKMTKKILSMQGIPEKILNEDEIQNKKIMRNLFIERD